MSMLLLMDDDAGFTPRSLFSAGEQGIWLDPSDFSTLFQDSAGTTPVTAVGQPVGKILDKSGRGNHATQSTSASRPTLQQDSNGMYYLSFDGTDDGMATPSIDFTGTDKMTVWVGVRKLSDAGTQVIVELSADKNANNGAFTMLAPAGVAATAQYGSKGTTASSATPSGLTPPVTFVLCGQSRISGPSVSARINGVVSASNTFSQGTGNYGNYPLYIGRRGGVVYPFNGHIYGLIGIGKLTSDAETLAIEKELAKRIGVTL